MTACTNNGGSRARRAVTAALVGVLSVGAAPMVALATGAAPASGDVSLQASLEPDQVAQSKVTEARDNTDHRVDLTKDIVFTYDRRAHFVTPVTLEHPVTGDVADVQKSGYTVKYFKVVSSGGYLLGNGERVEFVSYDGNDIVNVGDYYAVVTTNAADSAAGSNAFVKFSIVDATFEDAYVCDGNDKDDKVIEYDGTGMKFGDGDLSIVVNGSVFDYATDYTLQVLKAGTGEHLSNGAKDAGNYVVRLTHRTSGKTVDIPFTVSQLNLDDAKIVVTDDYATSGTTLPGAPTTVGDAAWGDIMSEVDWTFVGDTNGNKDVAPAYAAKGAYTYTVSVKDPDNKNITGSQEVTVVRYQNPANIRYDRDNIADGDTIRNFDPSLVDAMDANGNKLGVSIAYTKNGKVVDASETSKPGSYQAIITALDDTYTYGGRVTVDFTVSATLIRVEEVYASYKGETIKNDAIADIYSGSDLMENFSVKAIDEDDNEVPSDAIVAVVTDEDGKEVETVTEAGSYTISLKAADDSKYVLEGDEDEIAFTVSPVEIEYGWFTDNNGTPWFPWDDTSGYGQTGGNATVRLTGTMGYGDQADTAYLYTGEAITPSFDYDLTKAIWGYDKSEDWHSLPADTYEIEYQKKDDKGAWVDVEECVEAGDYKAVLKDAVIGDSYDVDVTVEFQISDTKVFVDVPNDEWYSKAVYKANELGYIGGIGGTNMFAPMANISRADVACVLYRMAGGKINASEEGMTNEELTFISDFSDVDPNAYYAKAVSWCVKMGIVNGYGDTFGSARSITTEEFATMLARYAAVCGTDTSVDTDAVLGAVADGDKVSGYARDAVAWAVSKGYVASNGNLIDPQGTVYRARAVVIAVRYQPEALDEVLVDNPNLDK
ncbi:S-layer homology domain-containing protein [Thermophilibacter mediterraneus]|uniref:S-layer homology domain-containing protein n=1 Tax=Thermophilibacter mediterraneus TaxID=1871031 RepID=UPI0009315C76|nr:S-layer homology domain-containing protein [Thermophilibacter mediterraneus]